MKIFKIFLSALAISAAVMTESKAMESLKFQYLGVNDGLSQHDITDIIQDRYGYVWIATYDGLNRYDGKNIEVFRHRSSDTGSLSGNRVMCLFEDSGNHIWIGTEGNGINCYSQITGKITRLDVPDNYRKVNSFAQIDDRRILAATSNGILMIDSEAWECKPVLESSVYGLGVNGFFRWHEELFVLTDQGICTYSHGEYLKLDNLPAGAYKDAAASDDGTGFFAATSSELFFFAPTGGGESVCRTERIDLGQPANIRALLYNRISGHLLAGTESRGIIIVDTETMAVRTELGAGSIAWRSLPADFVTCLYIDRQDILWAGTNEGLAYADLNALPFHDFAGCMGEPVGFVHAGDGYIYISVGNRYSKCFSTAPPYREIPSVLPEEIKKVIDYGGRRILAAASGIYISDGHSSHRYIPFNTRPVHSPERAAGYTSVEKDDFGNLYFSSWNGLVIKRKDGVADWAENMADICHSIAGKDVYTLEYEPGSKSLWAGTATSGLFRLSLNEDGSPGTLKIHNISGFDDNYIPSNSVWTIHVSRDSTVWAGTDAGLLRKTRNSDRFIQITCEGIIDRKIMSIIEDDEGNLWMGSSNSLLKYCPDSDMSEVFRYQDGLLSSTFTEAASSDADGILYFGGAGGITWFVPEDIRRKSCPTEIILSDFYINGKKVVPGADTESPDSLINVRSTLSLKWWQNDFSVDFSVLPYENIRKSQVRYRLCGFDRDWIYTDGLYSQISYKNLKSGTYRLEMESLDARRTLDVKVISAPWFSWWAWTLYTVCALLAGYAGIRELVRQQNLKREVELERLKHIQEEEMNDMQLRFFTDITHEFKTPLSLIIGPVNDLVKMGPANQRQKFCFGVIFRNVRRMSYMVSQLIDFRKIAIGRYSLHVEKDDLSALVRRMSEAFSWEAENGKIDFDVETPEAWFCWFDPDIIEKILYNLLSNAFHYTSPEGYVKLKLEKNASEDEMAEISVEDNGPGISEEQRRHIFERFSHGPDRASSGIGLDMSSQLIKVHHGEIRLDEACHSGARFVIRFPVNRQAFSEKETNREKRQTHASYVWQDMSVPKMSDSLIRPEQQSRKILLVEDDMELRAYLHNVLEQAFRVEIARNGKEALASVSKSSPDLILSDVMMPEMDGIEMLKVLKADSALSHIPVLLLTAKTDIEFQREGLAAGAFDYILKPFDTEVLFRKIDNVIRQQDVLKQGILKNIGISDINGKYTSYDRRLIEKLNGIIETRMTEPDFSVDSIAKELSLSRMSLHRKIKALTGLSMTGYVNIIRIRYAKNMFDSGCDRCNDAMMAIGIDSASYFNKLFKEQYGVSPSVYIDNHRNNNQNSGK